MNIVRVVYAVSTSIVVSCGAAQSVAGREISITDAASIQRALDDHPGQLIYVPAGQYEISQPIVIKRDDSGLIGPGRIVQTNPNVAIVIVSHADGVQLRDLTLTRASDQPTTVSGLVANSCTNLTLDNLQVLDNRAAASAINLDRCVQGRLSNCVVRNYTQIAIDDRTQNPNYGFAFRCIDGTGIQLTGCRAMLVQNNRVVEQFNLPTPELKAKFHLGEFTARNAQRGPLVSQESWDSATFPQWHQGSAIHVGEPEVADHVQIVGNYIENAAQGIDIHADHVTVASNTVNNAAVGVKAMHGSRNVLVIGNQLTRCDCHAILLQPGTASHAIGPPLHTDSQQARAAANVDGGSIIANNLVSDFGYGNANWMWGNERNVICFERGQTPENPPLSDVVVQGNVVYDAGGDRPNAAGPAVVVPPRYKYAVVVDRDAGGLKGPVNVRFANNLLHPGAMGVANIELEP